MTTMQYVDAMLNYGGHYEYSIVFVDPLTARNLVAHLALMAMAYDDAQGTKR